MESRRSQGAGYDDPCRHTRIRQVYIDANGVPDIAMPASSLLDPQFETVTATVILP
jgi:GH43 family beta-xylosidase